MHNQNIYITSSELHENAQNERWKNNATIKSTRLQSKSWQNKTIPLFSYATGKIVQETANSNCQLSCISIKL